MELHVVDAGIMAYQPAWDMQLSLHARVLEGELSAGALMLVEHLPVITIGRHPGSARHLLASPELLQARGVQVIETDRGGDITFHGPGQLVAYPILPLNTYKMNLHTYMRFLEDVVIATLARFSLHGERSTGATGVWVGDPGEKICAMGVKLRRWVTFHGLALNVSTDLSFFDLINPCGLGRPVTSLRKVLRESSPDMTTCKQALAEEFRNQLCSIHDG